MKCKFISCKSYRFRKGRRNETDSFAVNLACCGPVRSNRNSKAPVGPPPGEYVTGDPPTTLLIVGLDLVQDPPRSRR